MFYMQTNTVTINSIHRDVLKFHVWRYPATMAVVCKAWRKISEEWFDDKIKELLKHTPNLRNYYVTKAGTRANVVLFKQLMQYFHAILPYPKGMPPLAQTDFYSIPCAVIADHLQGLVKLRNLALIPSYKDKIAVVKKAVEAKIQHLSAKDQIPIKEHFSRIFTFNDQIGAAFDSARKINRNLTGNIEKSQRDIAIFKLVYKINFYKIPTDSEFAYDLENSIAHSNLFNYEEKQALYKQLKIPAGDEKLIPMPAILELAEIWPDPVVEVD